MFPAKTALALALSLAPISSLADIEVSATDFADGHFTYTLDTTNPTTYSNTHTNAITSQNGTGVGPSIWWPTYLVCFNGTRPFLRYRFNFANAGDVPRSVTIKDRLVHFNNGNNFTRSTVSVANSSSSLGSDFDFIRSAETPRDGSTVTDSFATYVRPLSGNPDFQYQVSMETLPGDFNGQLDSCLDQWARSAQGGEGQFSIAFSSDPPPSLNPLNFPDNSTIEITLNDPNGVDPATTPVASSLIASGSDATFNDGNESAELISTATQSWNPTNQTLTLTFTSPLPADAYQVTLDPLSFQTNHGQILPDANSTTSGNTPDFNPPAISHIQFNTQTLPQSDHLDGTLSTTATSPNGIASASFYYSQDGADLTLIDTDTDPSNGLSAPFPVSTFASGTYAISVHVTDTLGALSRLTLPFTVSEDPAAFATNPAAFNCTSQQLTSSPPINGGRFTHDLAIYGDFAAITSAPFANDRGLYIIQNQNGTWQEVQFIFPDDASTNDSFGHSVDLSHDIIAVGAYSQSSVSGSVYLYQPTPGSPENWTLLKKIPHPQPTNQFNFGIRVALHGNTLAVADNSQVYLFNRNHGGPDNWGLVDTLSPLAGTNESFGTTFGLDLHADTLAVSSTFFTTSSPTRGTAFVYERQNNSWQPTNNLFPTTSESSSSFGEDLSVFGNTIAVAAPRDDQNGRNSVGSTYLFEKQNNSWSQLPPLTPADAPTFVSTSTSVALYGNRLAIGSEDFSSTTGITGTVILYDRNEGGTNAWGEIERFAHPALGNAVALYANTLLAGADEDNLPGNNLNTEGSAHFFDTLPTPPVLGTLTFTTNSELAIPLSDDCPLPPTQSPSATSILASGGDGTFSDGNETELITSLTTISYDDPSNSILLTLDTPLPNDTYLVTLEPSSVVDHVGTPLAPTANTSLGLLDGPEITSLTFDNSAFPDPILLPGTISITASATNNLASAEFFLDGQSLGSDTDPSNGLTFTFDPNNFPPGSSTLLVTVTDANGLASSFSLPVNLAPILVTDFSPADIPFSEEFGTYLDYHNNLLAIGSPKTDNASGQDAGAVYLYQRNPLDRSWSFVKKFTPPDNSVFDLFGRAVALSDDILAVGHPSANVPGVNFTGAVHLYQRNLGGPDNWGLLTTLAANTPLAGGNFGRSLELANDLLVVGSDSARINNVNSGAAYLFERNEGGANNWGQVKVLLPPTQISVALFGLTLALDGDTLAVGSPQAHPNNISDAGAAYLFERNLGGTNNWGLRKEIIASDAVSRDYFSRGLALSGDLLVVGAPAHDFANGFTQGAAYCFSRNEGGENNWGQFLKIPSPSLTNNSSFGDSIAINSETLYISAPFGSKFSNSGVNPSFFGRGFIYLFDRNNNFTQTNRFAAPESDGIDGFGASLVVQGDILATASANDDVQTNTDNRGSAYIFDSSPPPTPPTPLVLANAVATYEQTFGGAGTPWLASETIDGDRTQNNGWAISGGASSPQSISWDVTNPAPGTHTFTLEMLWGSNHVLRNYTLSYSTDNGTTYQPITEYLFLSTDTGASLTADQTGLVTSGLATTDTHSLTTLLPAITNLRMDLPPNASHSGNFVLTEFSASVIIDNSIPPVIASPFFDSYQALLIPLLDVEPLPANLAPSLTTFLASGGDGTFADGNEIDLLPTTVTSFDPTSETIRLSSTLPLVNDIYQVTFDPTSIVNASGQELPLDNASFTVTQTLLTSFTLELDESSITENSTLNGTITLAEPWFEDLTITLASSRPSEINPGAPITIPAGQISAPFTITALNDSRLNAPQDVIISGSNPSTTIAETTVIVVDDDWPSLTLTLSRSTIAENAGSNAVQATITRDPVLPETLFISLTNNLPNAISAPTNLSIPSSAASITVNLSPIDNDTVDGPRTAEFTATGLALGTTVALSNTASLELGDDEGDSLELFFPSPFALEGTSGQLVLSNAAGNVLTDTEVSLATSDDSEITLPDSITLPANSSEVLIPFTIPADADGIQSIIISAVANGFTSTELPLLVIDTPLPDLTPANLIAPTLIDTSANIPFTYQISNSGLAPTSNTITQRLYLSTDQILDNLDPLFTQSEFSTPLEPGNSLPFSQNIIAPNLPGTYYLILVTDVFNQTSEISETNNILVSPDPITIQPAYTATVSASDSTYPANTPIPLTGSATLSNNTPAPGVLVHIHLTRNTTTRIITAQTDTSGNFSTTFNPLPNEGGDFQIGATHPGLTTAPVQDNFSILALNTTNFPTAAITFDEGSSSSTTGQLTNPSSITLTGLTTEVLGAPSGLTVTPLLSSTELPGNQSLDLQIDLAADPGFAQSGVIVVRVSTDQGVTIDIPLTISVSSLVANLIVSPPSLECAVLRGGQKLPEFTLTNIGGAATGPIDLALPGIPWLQAASANPVPSLAPGESTTISLTLTPPDTTPLTLFSGNIAINPSTSGSPLLLPFAFQTVSDLVGDLEIDVVNEFFYFTPEAPKLEGATVIVRDPVTSEQIAAATTGIDGLASFSNLTEAWYTVEVFAPEHTSWRNNIFLVAGQTTSRQAFLSKNLVTYNWTVEEIEANDQYRISVETTFEANVAAPVVTVTPSTLDVEDLIDLNDTKTIEVCIENHGLIDAENPIFEFSSHPFYEITPLAENLEKIPAQTKILVPLQIIRKGIFAADGSIQTLPTTQSESEKSTKTTSKPLSPANDSNNRVAVPCGMGGRVRYDVVCGPNNLQKGVPLVVSGAKGNCPQTSNNPAATIVSNIAENSPPAAPRSFYPGSSSSFGAPALGGSANFTNSPSTFAPAAGTIPFVGENDIQQTLADDFSSITFSTGTPCDCPFGFDITGCASGEAGFSLPNLLSQVTNKLNSFLPISLENPALSVSAAGKLCVCCEKGSYGTSGEGEIKGTLAAKINFGNPEPNLGGTFGNWQVLDARVDGGLVDVESEITFDVSIKFEKNCKGETSYCVNVGGNTKTFAGSKAEASIRARNLLTNEIYEGKIGGKIGFEFNLGAQAKWCSPGNPDDGEIKVVAKLEAIASLGGELSQVVIDRTQPNGDDILSGGVKFMALEFRAKLFEFPEPAATPTPASENSSSNKSLTQNNEPPTDDFDFEERFSRAEALPFDLSDFALPEEQILANPEVASLLPADSDAVCAKVGIQLDTNAVMTRSVFRASLNLTNNLPDDPLSDVNFSLDIRDTDGNPANDQFNIQVTSLSNLEAIDGTGSIPANQTGSAQWTLIPRDSAALTEDTAYTIGGSISYNQLNVPFTIPVEPAPITVRPDDSLSMKFFHQRDVIADDPLTPEVEPSQPFYLAVQVCNLGAGAANDLSLTTAQPTISDNEKGLAASFQIISAQVDDQPISPSLTAPLGTIAPEEKKTALWQLNSPILGLFTDYNATFEHLDSFGDPRISLLQDVQIHEMIRLVNALGDKDDGKPDFLTNDTPDPNDYPDTIHLSDGTTAPVTLLETASTNGSSLTYTINFTAPSGWTYLRIPDPSNGLILSSVQRSDGLSIPVNSNTWTSDKTLIGLTQPPVYENIFHLLDCDSTGSYTLNFTQPPSTDSTSPTSTVTMLAADSPTDVPVMWSGTDEDSGLARYDIFVSINNGPFELWLENTTQTSAIYSGQPGDTYSFYSVATDFAGNQESPPSSPDTSTSITISNQPPTIDPIDPQIASEGQTFFLTITATDPDGPDSALRYSVSSPANGLIINEITGDLIWTTTENDGNRTIPIEVTVSDPFESSTASFDLTINENNTPPIINPIPPQTIPALGLLLVTPTATDLDTPSQTLTYSLPPSAPSGMTIDPTTGLLSWSPERTLTDTTVEVDIIATDNGTPAESTSTTLSITVTPGDDQAPLFDALPIIVWTKGETFSATVSASDPDGDPILLAADTTSAPGSLFLEADPIGNSANSNFTWNTTNAATGTYNIPVSATANGAQVDANLIVNIRDNDLYWSWAVANFGSRFDTQAELDRTNFLADPDDDKRFNIHEFTFLTNPFVKDFVPIDIKHVSHPNFSTTTLTVHRRVGSHEYTRLRPLSSPDLTPESWSPINPRDWNALIDIRGDDDNNPLSESVDISIFDLQTPTGPARNFFRIESYLEP
ncbi:MAG: CARDB domain-containing protein [Verrucomicrobiota bacterium]